MAQWVGRLPGVREVMGSIPVGDSDFSLSHARVMLNISYSQQSDLFRKKKAFLKNTNNSS